MKSDWFKGAIDRDERKQIVRSALPALNVLKDVLEKRLCDLTAERRASKNYESPAWPMLQADFLGRERELEYLLDLLDQEDILK